MHLDASNCMRSIRKRISGDATLESHKFCGLVYQVSYIHLLFIGGVRKEITGGASTVKGPTVSEARKFQRTTTVKLVEKQEVQFVQVEKEYRNPHNLGAQGRGR